MKTPLEIPPQKFEQELRAGAPLVVVDTREPDVFERWHVESGRAQLVNVPIGIFRSDADAAAGRIPASRGVRVICNAGNNSLEVAQLLREHGIEALSVAGGMTAWGRVLVAEEVSIGSPTRVVQLRREARGCLSYLLVSGGEALAVDPAPGIEPYVEEATARSARITRVFDTHVHADHISGARSLADATGARLHLSSGAIARGVGYAERIDAVEDGDRIPLGSAEIRVIALPGHTTDMAGLLVDGRALVGGDSLFADSVARPDLEAGDEGAADAAETLWQTLRERIAPLPDDVVLLPCHYPGGRLDGPLAPTLGEVRRAVPRLGLDREAFVRELLADMPPRPANYLDVIAVNMGADVPDAPSLEIGGNSCAASAAWASPVVS